jgi:hypothetical protein
MSDLEVTVRLERVEAKLDKLLDRFIDLKSGTVTWKQVAGISAFITTGLAGILEAMRAWGKS